MKRIMVTTAAVAAVLAISGCSGSTKNVPGPTTTVHATITATATVEATVTARPVINKVIATRTRVQTETYTPPPVGVFSDGTYKVGEDIKPGSYRTDGPDGSVTGCYYERDSDLSGDSIISNDDFDGHQHADWGDD